MAEKMESVDPTETIVVGFGVPVGILSSIFCQQLDQMRFSGLANFV